MVDNSNPAFRHFFHLAYSRDRGTRLKHLSLHVGVYSTVPADAVPPSGLVFRPVPDMAKAGVVRARLADLLKPAGGGPNGTKKINF